jgi:hypothetical protein
MRRLLGASLLVLAVSGCHGNDRAAPLVPATGPPRTIRVAVESLGDPTIAPNVVELGRKPPFRVIDAGPRRIVAVRPGLRVEFVRMKPYAAAIAFRRGQVDVAPVPLGDLQAVLRDEALRGSVHVRPLLGVDLVRLDRTILRAVRRLLWLAADRADYRRLIPESAAGAAWGLRRNAPPADRPTVRELRRRAWPFHRVRIRLAGGYEAQLLAAWWREAGLDVTIAERGANAHFERVLAPYPSEEALFVAVLGRRAQSRPLATLDRELRENARIVPIAWVAGAKLVSRRLAGWRQDELGRTDYSRVHIRQG